MKQLVDTLNWWHCAHCDVLHSCTDEVISSIFIPQITDHKNPSVLRARGLRNHDWWVFELLRNLFGHIFPDISACKSITLEAWTIIKKKQCLHILKEPSQPSHFKESGWIKSINAHQCTCSYAIIWMYHLHYHVVDFSLVSSIARRSSEIIRWPEEISSEASLNFTRYYTVLHTHNTQIIYIHTYVYTVEYIVYTLHIII